MQKAVWRLSLLLFLYSHFVFSQADSTSTSEADSIHSPNFKKRKIILASSTIVLTGGSLIGLNQAWYSSYNTGKFHFFNDNQEWLQMDKAGHIYTTYQTSRLMMQAFDWAGYSRKQKLWIGGTVGLVYMTAIEIMDGYSRGWGYSWGDQFCDVVGASLAIGQQAAWNKQKIQLKFSFAKSGLAAYNPSLLGDSFSSQILKDYNGQTYWLSFSPLAFTKKENKFPKWLNVAVGYGAYGMLGGHYNRILAQNADGTVYQMKRERRMYLSLDIDLTQIKTRSKFLKSVFSIVNILKIPAPAIEFNSNGARAYAVYF